MRDSIENQATGENYKHNLALFLEKDALTSSQIIYGDFSQIYFCQTEKGELNLYRTKYGIIDYYHDQSGAIDQAAKTVQEISNQQSDVICYYGLGLGYVYDVLKEWLRKKPSRRLVLLEDDLEVVHCFLYTLRAREILQDPQVTLYHFPELKFDFVRLEQLLQSIFPLSFYFCALPYYAFRRHTAVNKLGYKLFYSSMVIKRVFEENLSGHQWLLANYYSNLLHLSESVLETCLFEKFKGVPVIVCGAGPSLEKNIELLKTLKYRALIFAAGSSLNAINSFGLIPHFGAGLDPNPEQFHRILTNDTFHLPIFYRNRVSYQAFEYIQGPKIFIPGATSVASWYEKELGVSTPSNVEEGYNVLNFCIEIARRLGCTPLIAVGMDLAFTSLKRYSSGIRIHPLWLDVSDLNFQSNKEVVERSDGLTTKWDWIGEANWISEYATAYPELNVINATEGGLGFYPVPNKTLEEAANQNLTKTYDLEGWIHAEIQAHPLALKKQQIIDKMNEFKSSLEICRNHCRIIAEEGRKQPVTQEMKAPHSPRAILHERLLHEEIAYQNFLQGIDQIWWQYQRSRFLDKKMTSQDNLNLFINAHEFLISVIDQHTEMMNSALEKDVPLSEQQYEEKHLPSDLATYKFEDNILTIVDPELHLNLNEKASSICHVEEDDSIRWEYYRAGGELHGPSRYYTKSGQLLSEAWFSHGKKVGKCVQYYASGRLYSIQRYLNDQPEGKQEYFYENGAVNTTFSFHKGRLEGVVSIYHSNQQLLRELHYHNGLRDGMERLWDHQGTLLIQCQYKDDIPIGKAVGYYHNGKIQKEVTIHRYPKDYDAFTFGLDGKLLLSFKHGVQDFSHLEAQRNEQIKLLNDSLKAALQKAEELFKDGQQAEAFQELGDAIKKIENHNKKKKDPQT